MAKLNNIYLYLISYILTKFNSYGQYYIQTSSPCPNIYQYRSNWFGVIKVPTPRIDETLLLEVEFILFGRIVSRDYGSLNLSRSREETLQLIFNKVPYIHYIIRFPKVYSNYDAPPQIIRILYNKNVICSGTTDTRLVQWTFKLQNLLYSQSIPANGNRNQFNNINNNIINNRPQVYFPSLDDDYDNYNFPVNQPVPTYASPEKNSFQYINQGPGFVQQPQPQQTQSQQPQSQQPQPQQPPINDVPQRVVPQVTSAPILPGNVRDENICGTVDSRFLTTSLVFGGEYIRHGQWPWLAAIFVANSHTLKYKCGGNLVSRQVVVSAAHCFVNGGTTISPNKINVHLGRHNLDIWDEDGQQQRQALLLQVHGDYMKTEGSFDADIAVIVLKRVVEYNVFVRPICLWSGNNDLSQIHGEIGTIVGWGNSEIGEEIEPKSIDISIVSQETCLRDSPEPFRRITSGRTFCAGYRNETGPCNGDSGSGLALRQNSKWALRGIVSASAAKDTIHRKCDLSQFVVFTDAARFTDFIKQYIVIF